jgi:hypothetical protein
LAAFATELGVHVPANRQQALHSWHCKLACHSAEFHR